MKVISNCEEISINDVSFGDRGWWKKYIKRMGGGSSKNVQVIKYQRWGGAFHEWYY